MSEEKKGMQEVSQNSNQESKKQTTGKTSDKSERDSAIKAREGLTNKSFDSGYESITSEKRKNPIIMPSPRMTSKEKKYQAYLNSQAERSADLRNDSIPLETPIALDVNTIRKMHDNIEEILSILKRNNKLSFKKKNNPKKKRTRRINIRPKTAKTSVKSSKKN